MSTQAGHALREAVDAWIKEIHGNCPRCKELKRQLSIDREDLMNKIDQRINAAVINRKPEIEDAMRELKENILQS